MTETTRRSLAVLGLGPMGGPMARRLLEFDDGLVVWNRTSAKAEPLGALGARAAASPADAASDVVLTVLPDLEQVESLLPGQDGLLSGWGPRASPGPSSWFTGQCHRSPSRPLRNVCSARTG
jgi:2-hydroxy-3-oxopropionate reductase